LEDQGLMTWPKTFGLSERGQKPNRVARPHRCASHLGKLAGPGDRLPGGWGFAGHGG